MFKITSNINLNVTDTGNKNTYQSPYYNMISYFSLNNVKILEKKIENNFILNNTEENLNSINWYPVDTTKVLKYPFIPKEIYYYPLPDTELEKEETIIKLLKNEDPISDLLHLKILVTGLLKDLKILVIGLLKEININLTYDLVRILLIWVKSELLLPVTGNKVTMREFTNITTFIMKSLMKRNIYPIFLEEYVHQYFVNYCKVRNLEINYLGVVGEKTLRKFHKMYSRYYLNSLTFIGKEHLDKHDFSILQAQEGVTVSAFQYGWYENELLKTNSRELRIWSKQIAAKAKYFTSEN